MKGVTFPRLKVIGLAAHSLKSFKEYANSLNKEVVAWPKLSVNGQLIAIRGVDNFLDALISLSKNEIETTLIVFDTLPILNHLGIEIRDMQPLDYNRWVKIKPSLSEPPVYTLYTKKMVTNITLTLAKKIHEKRIEQK